MCRINLWMNFAFTGELFRIRYGNISLVLYFYIADLAYLVDLKSRINTSVLRLYDFIFVIVSRNYAQ